MIKTCHMTHTLQRPVWRLDTVFFPGSFKVGILDKVFFQEVYRSVDLTNFFFKKKFKVRSGYSTKFLREVLRPGDLTKFLEEVQNRIRMMGRMGATAFT